MARTGFVCGKISYSQGEQNVKMWNVVIQKIFFSWCKKIKSNRERITIVGYCNPIWSNVRQIHLYRVLQQNFK